MIQRITNENLLKELKKPATDKKEVIEELNKRITFKKFKFTANEKSYLYKFLLESNKVGISRVLNDLLKDKEFIELLDSTEMSGSTIVSLTNFCKRPRKTLLKTSKKIKNSILHDNDFISIEDLLYDLTKEEVLILREDIEIDNALVNRGYRFDTLREETVKSIIEEPVILNLYDIKTVSEFANSYPNPEELVNNDNFMELYFSKLEDNYNYDNEIFKYLNKLQVIDAITKYKSDIINLHLLKDCNEDVQLELLDIKGVRELLQNCKNPLIIKKLPKEMLLDMLVNSSNVLDGLNYNVLESLSKKDFTYVIQNNPTIYGEIVDRISNPEGVDLEKCIKHLRSQHINDLYHKKIFNFDIDSLYVLALANKKEFASTMVRDSKVGTFVINSVTIKDYDKLENILKELDLSIPDMVKIISNLESVRDPKVINNLVEKIPQIEREAIYENDIVRRDLLLEENYSLDNFSVRYLINNIPKVNEMPSHLVAKLILNADNNLTKEILSNDELIPRVFIDLIKSNPSLLGEMLASKTELMPYYQKDELIKYYNRENLTSIIRKLDYNLASELCSPKIITSVLDKDQELIQIYKKLNNMNKFLLNTLDFSFLNEEIKNVKINLLSQITKYLELQNYIVEINKEFKINAKFITNIGYIAKDLSFEKEITSILKIFRDSLYSENKKYYGNLTKILSIVSIEEIDKDNYNKLISYLLYLIPRFDLDNKASRPIILVAPVSYNDIIDYEEELKNKLTEKIKELTDVKENFIIKHFKLTYNEALTFLNMFSLDRLDHNAYQKDLEYIVRLNKIIHTEEDDLIVMTDDYPIYTMYESFAIENNLKKLFGNIYNFEIRSRSYLQKPITKSIYGKELNMYECPQEFMLLTSNLNIEQEYKKTNSYIDAWYNTLNNRENLYIDMSLVTNDKPIAIDDVVFGFNGLLDDSIRLISDSHKLNNKYMAPRELIDNTRDVKNTILVDKFAVRPNFNNSNYPYIEPDFILASSKLLEDSTYLEKLSRASLEFKSKKNKNGLPIVILNYDKLAKSERKKLDNLYQKYNKSQDMYDFESILLRTENNYTSYNRIDEELKELFNPKEFIQTLKERIDKSSSVAELKYLDSVLVEESKKFTNISTTEKCNFDLNPLRGLIQDKIEYLND